MVVLIIIQSTFVSFINIYGVKPDIPLVFAMCITLIKGGKIGAFTGFLNGLLEDILFGRLLGFNAFIKLISMHILGYCSRDIYKGPAFITMALVFLSSVTYSFIFAIFSFFTKELTSPWIYFVPISIPSAIFNMILSPFIYMGVLKLEHFFDYYFDIKY